MKKTLSVAFSSLLLLTSVATVARQHREIIKQELDRLNIHNDSSDTIKVYLNDGKIVEVTPNSTFKLPTAKAMEKEPRRPEMGTIRVSDGKNTATVIYTKRIYVNGQPTADDWREKTLQASTLFANQ